LLDAGGRLHTTFIQTGAATGRFASKNPGVQNIPIKTELGRRIRNAFVAPKGKKLITFDYSQIELRLAAILSGDEKLQEIFKSGEDVHTAVAAEVFGVPLDKVDYEMRRRAKVINFGILYGMGVNSLRETLGTDRAEAQAYLTRYFDTYASLAKYLEKTKATATRLGYTTTLFGRKRYFPALKSKLPFMRAQAERMAINAPLQGTQADMIKLAMVRIHDLIKKEYGSVDSTGSPQAAIVLQIHDELMFEVSDARVADFAPKAKHLMESVLPPGQTLGVPITVQGEVGINWGEMEKI
jgi:DNA polymerase-1